MRPPRELVGARLRALREDALGLSPAEICREIEVLPSAWSQYENGQRDLTITVAMKLQARWGVSVDWLLFGITGNMPDHLRKALIAA